MRKLIIAAAGGIAVLGAVAITVPALAEQPTLISQAEAGRAEAVLLQGLIAQQQALTSPELSLAASSTKIRAAGTSAQGRASMKEASDRKLRKLFASKALVNVTVATDRGISALADPTFRALGGGADSMQIISASAVDSSTLDLSGTVRMWSRMAQVQGTKVVPATPSNLVDFKATLQKQSNGDWMTTAYTWSFHPGSAP